MTSTKAALLRFFQIIAQTHVKPEAEMNGAHLTAKPTRFQCLSAKNDVPSILPEQASIMAAL